MQNSYGVDDEIRDDDGDEFDGCVECWEEFRYDDTGGYNPPCRCGLHCERCHEIVSSRDDEPQDDETWEDYRDE
jgi:hypothetical protein